MRCPIGWVVDVWDGEGFFLGYMGGDGWPCPADGRQIPPYPPPLKVGDRVKIGGAGAEVVALHNRFAWCLHDNGAGYSTQEATLVERA